MEAFVFIGGVIALIFAGDAALRWWRQNAWKHRARDDDEDEPGDPSAT